MAAVVAAMLLSIIAAAAMRLCNAMTAVAAAVAVDDVDVVAATVHISAMYCQSLLLSLA